MSRAVRHLAVWTGIVALTTTGSVVSMEKVARADTQTYCAGAVVQTYEQVGSVERVAAGYGNIVLDLTPQTGTPDCYGEFPGGTLWVAVAFCRNNTRFSDWHTFTYAGRQDIAAGVAAGTCYKLTWKGTTDIAGRRFQGRVIWPR